VLFSFALDYRGLTRNYDISTDGRRFLLLEQVEAEGQPLTLITNWLEAPKK
jgi:hypothetical protein